MIDIIRIIINYIKNGVMNIYLPHRKEPRGIGGIFFDYKRENFEKDLNWRDVGITFQLIFNSIIKRKIKKNGLLKIKKLNI